MIDVDLLLKYDGNYPRYTSYPTAPHFSDKITSQTYQNWLKNLPENQRISLYFHIPFCQQMCWYCGCFTTITKRYAPIENYVRTLIDEFRLVADLVAQKNLQVSHIHFGGGSPTILLPQDFAEIMQEIRQHFVITSDAEIAIEIDPRNVNEEKIKTYAREGINRASIGVQDFNVDVQKAINREQSFDVVYDCVKMLRQNGNTSINFDLIYGLPEQTVEMVKKNIDISLLMNPDRIALFGYAHVKWKKKQMRLINEADLPNEKERILTFREASKKLEEVGFFPIGLDHFVKKNDSMFQAFVDEKLKRNFQGYSSDNADILLGFGASSISYLPFGYVQNTADFEQYKKAIFDKNLAVIKGIELSESDKIRKAIIDEIMCYLEVDLKKFALSEEEIKNLVEDSQILANLKKDGLLRFKNNTLKINTAAPQISRIVASVFDQYFQNSAQQFSKAL